MVFMSRRRNGFNNGVIGGNASSSGSFGVLSNAKNTQIKSDYITEGKWTRPTDWVAMPSVTTADQKICITHAVWNTGSNFVSFRITAPSGYTVNWGDGTTTNYATNTTAERNYDYTTVSGVNPTVTSDGHLTVMITITPQAGNITGFNFSGYRHSSAGGSTLLYKSGILEVLLSAPYVNAPYFSSNSSGGIEHTNCQQFDWIGTNLVTSTYFNYFFINCYGLISVPNLYTATTSGMTALFYQCESLKYLPQNLNTSSATTFSYMFYNCNALEYLPWLNTSNGTVFDVFAYGCVKVKHVPQYNLSKATTTYLMFYNCYSVMEFPAFNCPLATTIEYMFGNCHGAKKIGKVTTSTSLTSMSRTYTSCENLQVVEPPTVTTNVTSCYQTFYNCVSLRSVPLFDTAKVTTFFEMFRGAVALESVPSFVTTLGQNFNGMFYQCYGLKTVPTLNTVAGTDFSNMFNTCTRLQTFTGLTFTGTPTMTSMFSGCTNLKTIPTTTISATATPPSFSGLYSLQSCGLTGIGQNCDFTNCQMSATKLNSLYTSLATVVSKTITVTGNWGTATDTTSTATNKGWTVTG